MFLSRTRSSRRSHTFEAIANLAFSWGRFIPIALVPTHLVITEYGKPLTLADIVDLLGRCHNATKLGLAILDELHLT